MKFEKKRLQHIVEESQSQNSYVVKQLENVTQSKLSIWWSDDYNNIQLDSLIDKQAVKKLRFRKNKHRAEIRRKSISKLAPSWTMWMCEACNDFTQKNIN